jgi:monofunctional biosynthetic peptidoglycan transglycosylase
MQATTEMTPKPSTRRRSARARRGWKRRVALLAGWLAIAFMAATLLPVLALRWIDPPTSAFMLQRRVAGIVNPARRVAIDYRWVDFDDMSPSVRLSVVAAEDQRFLEHGGFDFESIRKALEDNKTRQRPRGASTITQQVAKNLFLWPGRNVARKGMEAAYTVMLEVLWPKRRILEVYLNIAEFGDGIYGVGAASRRYFDRAPSRLTRHQAALLAAVLPSPRRMHADRPSSYVQRRSWWIERQMYHLGGAHLQVLDGGG